MVENEELAELLRSIIAVDKTPEYDYGAKAVNRAGKSPPTGSRWMTPQEICENKLKEMNK